MDIKEHVEALNTAFSEFKKTNDELLKHKAEGKSVADLEEKLNKLNGKIDEHSKVVDRLAAIETALKRTTQSIEEKNGLPNEDMKAYRELYIKSMRRGLDQKEEAHLRELEAKTLSVNSDADGGFTVPTDMSGRIAKRVFETSPMRQYASVVTISTDALEGPVDAEEFDSGWVGETQSRAETTTGKIGMYRIPTHEVYAKPKISQKLLDDGQWDWESWITKKIADRFARRENLAFVSGNGITKPKGFLAWDTVADDRTANYFSLKKLGYIVSGKSADFPDVPSSGSAPAQGDPLINLQTALKSEYRNMPGTAWAMNATLVGRVRRLRDNQGHYLWMPGFGTSPSTLLGFPIAEFNDMPALAADSFSVAFGNWAEGYSIVDRIGIRILRDPFSSKPHVEFYATKRVGGDVVNPEAIKLLKFGTA